MRAGVDTEVRPAMGFSTTRAARLITMSITIAALVQLLAVQSAGPAVAADEAPPPGGYFSTQGPGSWSGLPSGDDCIGMVHRSSWEPRPDNDKRNHVLVDAAAVHASFAARPRSGLHTYDPKWDTWLLARVDGQFSGTTDEIFQWASCKWGLSDDLVRAIAVRESTWFQYETYPGNRCVTHFACGDFFEGPDDASRAYCSALVKFGYDYQADYGDGLCPKTFSIAGVMDWWNPSWGFDWPDNQNGAFPFNRDSTAFAVDYLAGVLRGCYEGWQWELGKSYGSGDLWGCVGAWYSGLWHDAAADGYIDRVKAEIAAHRWLDPSWPREKPACNEFGCPGPDTLDEDGDRGAPEAAIQRPANGSRRFIGKTYTVLAVASDDSGIESVTFYLDGRRVGVDYQAPFRYRWHPTRMGFHSLRAVATDVYGNQSSSTRITIRTPRRRASGRP
jgi:hypothetical protein